MCQCFHQRSVISNNGAAVVLELNCKSWNCEECAAKNRRKWLDRFREFSKTCVSFEVTRVPAADYPALRSRLRRAGCRYMSIRTSDGYAVFHQRFVGNRQSRAFPSRWLSPERMLLEASQAIQEVYYIKGHHCITASDGVPYPDAWRKKTPWTLICRTSVTTAEMNRRLMCRGIDRNIRLGKAFSVDLLPPILGDGLELAPNFYEALGFLNPQGTSAPTEVEWWPRNGARTLEAAGCG